MSRQRWNVQSPPSNSVVRIGLALVVGVPAILAGAAAAAAVDVLIRKWPTGGAR